MVMLRKFFGLSVWSKVLVRVYKCISCLIPVPMMCGTGKGNKCNKRNKRNKL